MGSCAILVIGNDWRQELDRFQSIEYAAPSSPYIVNVDRLPDALKSYPEATELVFRLPNGVLVREIRDIPVGVKAKIVTRSLKDAPPFADWARTRYGLNTLDVDASPDLHGRHGAGWIRASEAGEVLEIVERTISGGFYFYLMGTCSDLLLKPGAVGWDIDQEGERVEVREGRAGSARLCDIDFATMREEKIEESLRRWDLVHRAADGASWVPHALIRQRYPGGRYDQKVENAASQEWFAQPALERIHAAGASDDYTHAALDPMLMPREEYLAWRLSLYCALSFYDVIRQGRHLVAPSDEEILADLPPDVLLTSVAVKC